MAHGSAPIMVWPFENSPKEHQLLSPHGGNEAWLAVVIPGMARPSWMADGTPFAPATSSEHVLADGSTVVIGVTA